MQIISNLAYWGFTPAATKCDVVLVKPDLWTQVRRASPVFATKVFVVSGEAHSKLERHREAQTIANRFRVTAAPTTRLVDG